MRIILLIVSLLFLSQAIMGKEKRQGYYWDKKGEKHVGEFQLKHSIIMGAGTSVKFYQNGKKQGRLTQENMNSFVLGRDSFALINNFEVAMIGGYSSDFAKIVKVGKMNLYLHRRKVRSSGGPGSIPISPIVSVYVVQKEGESEYIGIYNNNQFEKNFLPLIDDEDLKASILNMKRRDWLESLPDFVEEYNKLH